MTAREFLKVFENTADAFVWKYASEGRIRGFPKSGDTGRGFDPIEATLVAEGLPDLELSALDREAITDGAEGKVWKSAGGQVVLDAYAAWLRDEMATRAGLGLDDVPRSVPSRLNEPQVGSGEFTFEAEAEPQHV